MLHAGNTNPASVGKYYEMRNGRVHTHSNINVAWQLNATREGDEGFCIIPGVLRRTARAALVTLSMLVLLGAYP